MAWLVIKPLKKPFGCEKFSSGAFYAPLADKTPARLYINKVVWRAPKVQAPGFCSGFRPPEAVGNHHSLPPIPVRTTMPTAMATP